MTKHASRISRRTFGTLLAGTALGGTSGNLPSTYEIPAPPSVPQDNPDLNIPFQNAQARLGRAMVSTTREVNGIIKAHLKNALTIKMIRFLWVLPEGKRPPTLAYAINDSKTYHAIESLPELISACAELEKLYQAYNKNKLPPQRQQLDYNYILHEIMGEYKDIHLGDVEPAITLMLKSAALNIPQQSWYLEVSGRFIGFKKDMRIELDVITHEQASQYDLHYPSRSGGWRR